ncbi:thioredoxin-disulfide reductase [Haloplasma contractile]|uniref:Thioredoxin reductase n=1 Tax=Haloplasma contractile SSD-17B TaxID=1033810 RepID=U2EET8_9MOLU|nr:thioredoxin-disulfide reductase [Haloplasma contractile]ERJ13211.1 Thioredoxin reductase protein [Haloplasma contractile SSD-17B]
MVRECDVLIIGAGPAGLTSALYSARAKMDTVLVDKSNPGGQIAITHEVANYPGSPNDTGPKLIEKMVDQAKQFGAEIIRDCILSVDFSGDIKIVKSQENEYHAKAVIIATGANPRKIGCPGENKLIGKGVSYCATCDADFFTDLEVFVIGGGDTAVEEGMYLTKFARKVTVVHRRDELRAAKSIQEKAFKNEKIHFMWDTVVNEIKGDGIVESIVFENRKTNEVTEYFADEEDGTFGVFPFVGYTPNSSLFEGLFEMDWGYIKTDDNMKTNIEGVYAAGDIRIKSLRQVVTATADGAIAAVQAEKYIEDKFKEE